MTDVSGVVRYGTGVMEGEAASSADRAFFAVHRSGSEGGLVVSNPIFGRVSKAWVIMLSRRYNQSQWLQINAQLRGDHLLDCREARAQAAHVRQRGTEFLQAALATA